MNDIDRLLRDDARAPLPDDGFTRRVLARLPAPAAATHPWLRPVLVLGSAALGSALAVLLAPGGVPLLEGFADLVQMRGFTPAAVTGLAMAGALGACALVLLVEAD
jgi:hypothetical protein